MPLVPISSLLDRAVAGGHGLGAFNVVHVEHAEAHVAGAEQAGAPVVLQISENAVRWHGRMEPIAVATIAVARHAKVPVAVHLDHATSPSSIEEAIRLGFGSVMFDGSQLPWDENVALTRRLADMVHDEGMSIEAELGEVGGKNGVHDPGARTDPSDAQRFVEETRIDSLAVAVGSSHAMTTRSAELDLDLVRELHAAVDVPLVLHGSSGVPDQELSAAVEAGMTKVNIATHLNAVFTTRLRATLCEEPELVDTRRYFGPARDATAREVTRLLSLVGASETAMPAGRDRQG